MNAPLSLTLSPYLALLIITVVGSGATFAILHSLALSREYAAYLPGMF